MLYISVRPERASYELIKEQMEFTVNLTTRQLCRATDWCGVRSGRDYDKWREMGLTAAPGVKVACPHVAESPMSIECRVKSIVPLGTHHMFIAEVLSVLADEQYLDPTTGAFDMERAGLIAYAHGGYYTLGEKLGKFGFSVQKKNNKH
jgi:flavin reductase (DIM6/NTAB) family NADH-FMN oxidoreductase RutF